MSNLGNLYGVYNPDEELEKAQGWEYPKEIPGREKPTLYLSDMIKKLGDEKAFSVATDLRAKGYKVIVDAESIIKRAADTDSAFGVLQDLSSKGYQIKVNQATLNGIFEDSDQAAKIALGKGWEVYSQKPANTKPIPHIPSGSPAATTREVPITDYSGSILYHGVPDVKFPLMPGQVRVNTDPYSWENIKASQAAVNMTPEMTEATRTPYDRQQEQLAAAGKIGFDFSSVASAAQQEYNRIKDSMIAADQAGGVGNVGMNIARAITLPTNVLGAAISETGQVIANQPIAEGYPVLPVQSTAGNVVSLLGQAPMGPTQPEAIYRALDAIPATVREAMRTYKMSGKFTEEDKARAVDVGLTGMLDYANALLGVKYIAPAAYFEVLDGMIEQALYTTGIHRPSKSGEGKAEETPAWVRPLGNTFEGINLATAAYIRKFGLPMLGVPPGTTTFADSAGQLVGLGVVAGGHRAIKRGVNILRGKLVGTAQDAAVLEIIRKRSGARTPEELLRAAEEAERMTEEALQQSMEEAERATQAQNAEIRAKAQTDAQAKAQAENDRFFEYLEQTTGEKVGPQQTGAVQAEGKTMTEAGPMDIAIPAKTNEMVQELQIRETIQQNPEVQWTPQRLRQLLIDQGKLPPDSPWTPERLRKLLESQGKLPKSHRTVDEVIQDVINGNLTQAEGAEIIAELQAGKKGGQDATGLRADERLVQKTGDVRQEGQGKGGEAVELKAPGEPGDAQPQAKPAEGVAQQVEVAAAKAGVDTGVRSKGLAVTGEDGKPRQVLLPNAPKGEEILSIQDIAQNPTGTPPGQLKLRIGEHVFQEADLPEAYKEMSVTDLIDQARSNNAWAKLELMRRADARARKPGGTYMFSFPAIHPTGMTQYGWDALCESAGKSILAFGRFKARFSDWANRISRNMFGTEPLWKNPAHQEFYYQALREGAKLNQKIESELGRDFVRDATNSLLPEATHMKLSGRTSLSYQAMADKFRQQVPPDKIPVYEEFLSGILESADLVTSTVYLISRTRNEIIEIGKNTGVGNSLLWQQETMLEDFLRNNTRDEVQRIIPPEVLAQHKLDYAEYFLGKKSSPSTINLNLTVPQKRLVSIDSIKLDMLSLAERTPNRTILLRELDGMMRVASDPSYTSSQSLFRDLDKYLPDPSNISFMKLTPEEQKLHEKAFNLVLGVLSDPDAFNPYTMPHPKTWGIGEGDVIDALNEVMGLASGATSPMAMLFGGGYDTDKTGYKTVGYQSTPFTPQRISDMMMKHTPTRLRFQYHLPPGVTMEHVVRVAWAGLLPPGRQMPYLHPALADGVKLTGKTKALEPSEYYGPDISRAKWPVDLAARGIGPKETWEFIQTNKSPSGPITADMIKNAKTAIVRGFLIDPDFHIQLGVSRAQLREQAEKWTGVTRGALEYERSLNARTRKPHQRWEGISRSAMARAGYIDRTLLAEIFDYIIEDPGLSGRPATPNTQAPPGHPAAAGPIDPQVLASYLYRAVESFDTRISWRALGVAIRNTIMRDPDTFGVFNPLTRQVQFSRNEQHTIPHELAHFLANMWALECAKNVPYHMDATSLFDPMIFDASGKDARWVRDRIAQDTSPERYEWMKKFYNFVQELVPTSDIRTNYTGRNSEIFARFAAAFVDWVQKKSGDTNWTESGYFDTFNEKQYHKFVQLLQEKAQVDALDGNPYGLKDTSKMRTRLEYQGRIPPRHGQVSPNTMTGLDIGRNTGFALPKEYEGVSIPLTGPSPFSPADSSGLPLAWRDLREPTVKRDCRTFEDPKWVQETIAAAQAKGWSQDQIDHALDQIRLEVDFFRRYPDLLPWQGGDWSAVKSNNDFPYSLEVNTICSRTAKYHAMVNLLEAAVGRKMSPDQMLHLGIRMQQQGHTSFCIFCYVEAGRRFRNGKAKAYTEWTPQTAGQFKEASEALKQHVQFRDSQLAKMGRSLDWFRETVSRLSSEDIKKMRDADPEFDKLYKDYHNYHVGNGADLTTNGHYNHEYLKIFQANRAEFEYMVRRGGVRAFSLTDMEPTGMIDVMQAVLDMSILDMPSHCYVKEPYAVLIFGDTNMKINMSVALNTQADGSFIEDVGSGMPWNLAQELRARYKNAGTTLVAKDDKQMEFGLKDPRVDYIIPEHNAFWTDGREEIYDLHDYSKEQYEQWVKDKRPNVTNSHELIAVDPKFLTEKANIATRPMYSMDLAKKLYFTGHLIDAGWDIQLAVKNYLAFCDANDIVPKFAKYRDDPGYYKLLVDFARVDSPQQGLRADFNTTRATEWLQKFVEGRTLPKGGVRGDAADVRLRTELQNEFSPLIKEFKRIIRGTSKLTTKKMEKAFDALMKEVSSGRKEYKGIETEKSLELLAGEHAPGAVTIRMEDLQDPLKMRAKQLDAEADALMQQGVSELSTQANAGLPYNEAMAQAIIKKTTAALLKVGSLNLSFDAWAESLKARFPGIEPFLEDLWKASHSAAKDESAKDHEARNPTPPPDTRPVPPAEFLTDLELRPGETEATEKPAVRKYKQAAAGVLGPEAVKEIPQGPVKDQVFNIVMNPGMAIWDKIRGTLTGTGWLLPGEKLWRGRVAARAAYHILNDLAPLWRVLDKAEGIILEELLPQDDPRILSRGIRRFTEKFTDTIDYGVPAPDGSGRMTRPFKSIFEPFGDPAEEYYYARLRSWSAWGVAKRNMEEIDMKRRHVEEVTERVNNDPKLSEVERKKKIKEAQKEYNNILERDRTGTLTGLSQGKKGVSDSEVALRIIGDIAKDPALEAMYRDVMTRYNEWAIALLDYMARSGRITQERADFYRGLRENYVDLHRFFSDFDHELHGNNFGVTQDNVLAQAKKVLHGFHGSGRRVLNAAENLLISTYQAMYEADRNRVMTSIADFWDQRAVVMDPNDPSKGKATWLAAFGERVEPVYKDGKEVIPKGTHKIFRDGKEEHWRFEEFIDRALTKIDEAHPLPWGWTIMARLMRESVIIMPFFAVRNVIRDAFERSVVSEHGSKPWDSLKPLSKEEVSQAKRYGGVMGGWYLQGGPENYYRFMKHMLLFNDGKSATYIPEAWEKYKNLLASSELRGRMGEYRRAYEYARKTKGYDEVNSALYAADKAGDLPNFTIAGDWIRTLNQVIPFTNAGIQGAYRAFRAAKKNFPRALAYFSLYILLPKLVEYAWNNRDEESRRDFQNLDRARKDMFLNFRITPDFWIKIPLGFEMSILASGVTRALDRWQNGNPEAFTNYWQSLWQGLIPVQAQDIAAGPVPTEAAMLANYDWFYDRHQIPVWDEGLMLDKRQGAKNQSAFPQMLSDGLKKLGVEADPRMIDYWFNGHFTNVYKAFRATTDVAAGLPGAKENLPQYLAESGKDMLGSWLGLTAEGPGMNSTAVQELYSEAKYWGDSRKPHIQALGGFAEKIRNAKDPQKREQLKRYAIQYAEKWLKYYRAKKRP